MLAEVSQPLIPNTAPLRKRSRGSRSRSGAYNKRELTLPSIANLTTYIVAEVRNASNSGHRPRFVRFVPQPDTPWLLFDRSFLTLLIAMHGRLRIVLFSGSEAPGATRLTHIGVRSADFGTLFTRLWYSSDVSSGSFRKKATMSQRTSSS